MTKLFLEAGTIVLCAFISPFMKNRQQVKAIVGENNFVQIYCKCPIEVCEQRDVKGHYKKARKGLIKNFTGISSPYEESEGDLTINTVSTSLEDSVKQVIDLLKDKDVFHEGKLCELLSVGL